MLGHGGPREPETQATEGARAAVRGVGDTGHRGSQPVPHQREPQKRMESAPAGHAGVGAGTAPVQPARHHHQGDHRPLRTGQAMGQSAVPLVSVCVSGPGSHLHGQGSDSKGSQGGTYGARAPAESPYCLESGRPLLILPTGNPPSSTPGPGPAVPGVPGHQSQFSYGSHAHVLPASGRGQAPQQKVPTAAATTTLHDVPLHPPQKVDAKKAPNQSSTQSTRAKHGVYWGCPVLDPRYSGLRRYSYVLTVAYAVLFAYAVQADESAVYKMVLMEPWPTPARPDFTVRAPEGCVPHVWCEHNSTAQSLVPLPPDEGFQLYRGLTCSHTSSSVLYCEGLPNTDVMIRYAQFQYHSFPECDLTLVTTPQQCETVLLTWQSSPACPVFSVWVWPSDVHTVPPASRFLHPESQPQSHVVHRQTWNQSLVVWATALLPLENLTAQHQYWQIPPVPWCEPPPPPLPFPWTPHETPRIWILVAWIVVFGTFIWLIMLQLWVQYRYLFVLLMAMVMETRLTVLAELGYHWYARGSLVAALWPVSVLVLRAVWTLCRGKRKFSLPSPQATHGVALLFVFSTVVIAFNVVFFQLRVKPEEL